MITIEEWSDGVMEHCGDENSSGSASFHYSSPPVLHYSIFQTGAPGRTRTDEYEFTKLAL